MKLMREAERANPAPHKAVAGERASSQKHSKVFNAPGKSSNSAKSAPKQGSPPVESRTSTQTGFQATSQINPVKHDPERVATGPGLSLEARVIGGLVLATII
ncbi:MAG: hypothetical protein WB699_06385, partial [Bacteroidota bacterium]